MIELAVNVVHAFATLLPAAGENAVLVARAPGLVKVLPEWWVVSFFLFFLVPGEREEGNEDFGAAARRSRQRQYYRRCCRSQRGGRVRRSC